MYRKFLPLFLLFINATAFAQVPSIISFSPASGAAGSTVTINGNNFAATAAKNVVFIGGVKAAVLSASTTKLTVTVPVGATYGPISVAINNLTAYSLNPFVVTYPDGGSMFETLGPGAFGPKNDLFVGNDVIASGLISADFDGDGKPDIATLASTLGVYIYKNLGDRNIPFGSIPSLKLNKPGIGFFESAGLIATGDFNGDGKPDIVASYYTTGGNLAVLLNTSTPGNLSFAAPVLLTTGSYPTAIITGDFNGDGKLDIATSNNGTNPTFSVLLNSGTGANISFAARQEFPAGGDPTSIAVGDFDADGKLDIVTANHAANTVSVARNTTANGILSFAPKTDFVVSATLTPITVLTADLDGDGKTDIITTNHLDFGQAKTGSLLRNTSTPGNIAFSAKADYYTGEFSSGAAIADVDGDGRPDVVLVDKTSNTGTIFSNFSVPGTFKLGAGYTISGLNYPAGALMGDFTGDGKADVVILSQGGSGSIISTVVNTVNPANAVITSVSSWQGGEGDKITITGTHFTGATSVKLGGDAASYTVVSPTTIKAVVGGSSGNVSVTTPTNTAALCCFTFINKPRITGITVTPSGSNYLVVINGIYLSNPSAISFDGTPAVSIVAGGNDGQVTAIANTNTFSTINLTTPGGLVVFNNGPLPKITKLSTVTASEGSSITITGTNFINVTAVTLGNTPAASYQVLSPTSIQAVYGKGNTGEVDVTTLYGKATSVSALPSGFVNFAGPPIISSLSQTLDGQRVSIKGLNFPVNTTVTFGGVAAFNVNVSDWSDLTATVYNGVNGDVVVTTPYGSATYPGFVFLVPTVIKSFSGNTSTGSAVTITGTGLDQVTGITLGGVPAQSFTINSSTSITAIVGVGNGGLPAIVATFPSGTSTLGGFNYTPSAPVITSFSPINPGSQQVVNIEGTDFYNVSAVTFGGIPAASFVVNSVKSITAVTGTGTLTNGNVTVTTSKGTATLGGFGVGGAPVISSFTPLAAPQGATVTITGSNFTGAKSVSFGTVAATSFTVNSATSITAVVGAGKTGNVKVVTPNGTAILPGFKFGALPVITSFSPASAQTGTVVTITGSNFTGATAVTFGGVAAASFAVNSATSITAVVGTGKSGNVVVTTPSGSFSLAGFTLKAAPTLTSISPATAATGASVIIRGTDLSGVTSVSFGGVRATSFTINSAGSITAVVGAGASGVVKITSPDGAATINGFIYKTTPVITSFNPLEGKTNTKITIKGVNFTGATAVAFGGKPALSFTVNSATSITAVVGQGNSGNIKVTTPAGSIYFAGFTYDVVPFITSFTPSSGTTGTAITINGTGFTGATAVNFGGIPAQSFTVNSPTSITATVGTGRSGVVKVINQYGSDTSAGFTFLKTNALPPAPGGAGNLSMAYNVSRDNKKVNLILSGGSTYHIQLNKALYITTDSTIVLPLGYGTNELTLNTDNAYQGSIKRIITTPENIHPYPDPFEGNLYLNIGNRKIAKANVVVFSSMATILYQKDFNNPSDIIKLDLAGIKMKGIYTLRVTLDGVPQVYKIIRK